MGIYLIELLITILIGLLCGSFFQSGNRGKKIFLCLTGAFLAIVSGLRNNMIGTDTLQYYNAFQVISSNQYAWLDYKSTRYEVGYFWLNKVVGIFTTDPQVFLLVTSVITMIGVFLFIYNNSSNVIYSVILYQTMYYYCNSMNLVRQYIAVAVVINSFTFIKQRKMIKACILVFIGGLFHTSALLMLPIVIVFSRINISAKNIYKIVSIIVGISLLIPLLIKMVIIVFPRYEFYLTYSSDFNGGKIMPLIYLTMVFAAYFSLSRMKAKNERGRSCYLLSLYILIGALLSIVSNMYFESANRLTNYFLIYFIIFVPELIKFLVKGSRIIFYIIFFILSTSYYIILISNGVAGVFPFTFYWQ